MDNLSAVSERLELRRMVDRDEAKPVEDRVFLLVLTDLEAVARVRELLPGVPPSSPSVALFQDGRPVWVLHRREIESREAPEIAKILTDAFDRYCAARLA